MKRLHRLFYPPAWTIAAKLSTALVAAALIPMCITSYHNLRQSLNSMEASEYHKLELLAASTASRLDQFIIDLQRVVVQVSGDRNIVNFLAATTSSSRQSLYHHTQQTLENVFHSNPDYDAVFILDRNGRCLAATDSQFVDRDYSFREYFRQAIRGKSYVSGILVGQTTKRSGMFFASPVKSEDGKIVGVTVLKIKGEEIWAIVNSLKVSSQSYAFLVDRDGVVISHPDRSMLYHSLNPLSSKTMKQILSDRRYGSDRIESLNIPELAGMVEAKKPNHTSYYSHLEDRRQIIGFAPLKIEPWVLGVNQPKAQFVLPLNHLIWQNITSVFLVGGVTAIAALLLGRSISRPIRLLTVAAQALEDDDFDSHVLELHNSLAKVSHTQDDIGHLVQIFLEMAEKVRMRDQKLKMEVQELRIEIDRTKKDCQVAEITENEHFRQLQKKIQKLREQKHESETEYFDRLQNKVRSLKQRST
jgi:C4-dicarboxylate-specific signal transduction histidine kinase